MTPLMILIIWALQTAKETYEIDVPVTFSIEYMGKCQGVTREWVKFHMNDIPPADNQIAITEKQVSRITFHGEPGEPDIVSYSPPSWHIRFNSGCEWGKYVPILQSVEHEYSHALGLHDHSTDPHSVRYPYPEIHQKITPEDIKLAREAQRKEEN